MNKKLNHTFYIIHNNDMFKSLVIFEIVDNNK